MKSLCRALDAEFRRVAKAEDVRMSELVTEVAELTGVTERQLYNYRVGKWPLPSSLIPVLCRRFKSLTLLEAVAEAVGADLEAPNGVDVTTLSVEILREVTDHHFRVLTALKGSLDRSALNELDEATDRVIRRERLLFSLLQAEYERTRERQRA